MNIIKTKRSVCVVTGVNGQDGSYLAEILLDKGFHVIGLGRQDASEWVAETSLYDYRKVDLSVGSSFSEVLEDVNPDFIFYAAAVHGASGFDYEKNWDNVYSVNVRGIVTALQYLEKNREASLTYISSSKVFDMGGKSTISETDHRLSNCLYSVSKNAATDIIHYYRDRYRLNCSVFWTFNHESPRRGEEYFIPKIVKILQESRKNNSYNASIFSLDFYCDWGDAREYMNIIIDLSLTYGGEDFILGTGKNVLARQVVSELFEKFGLDYKDHITEVNGFTSNIPLLPTANVSKLKHYMRKIPQKNVTHVFQDILDNTNFAPKGKL